ncbi:MAG TPA: LemA family protein [Anaerolineales bacterium]
MKHPIHRAFSILGALVILVQVTSCNLLRSGTDEYNDLVALVQGVQSAASNFQLVTDTQYAKIQAKTQITKDYYDAVSNSGEVWTGNFRSEQEILNELLRKYRDANGQPLDPTQLNLDALQDQGALPDGLGQGFTLFVNAVVQAPPPVPAPEVTLALGDTIDEGMNTIQLAGTDWNDAVEAYNTRRSQIPGEVVARVSEYFGFELPVAFPYYQGANPGAPVQNPLATPPTPTP